MQILSDRACMAYNTYISTCGHYGHCLWPTLSVDYIFVADNGRGRLVLLRCHFFQGRSVSVGVFTKKSMFGFGCFFYKVSSASNATTALLTCTTWYHMIRVVDVAQDKLLHDF